MRAILACPGELSVSYRCKNLFKVSLILNILSALLLLQRNLISPLASSDCWCFDSWHQGSSLASCQRHLSAGGGMHYGSDMHVLLLTAQQPMQKKCESAALTSQRSQLLHIQHLSLSSGRRTKCQRGIEDHLGFWFQRYSGYLLPFPMHSWNNRLTRLEGDHSDQREITALESLTFCIYWNKSGMPRIAHTLPSL